MSPYAVLEFALTGLAVAGCGGVLVARATRALRAARAAPAAGAGGCGGTTSCGGCGGCGSGSTPSAGTASTPPDGSRPGGEAPLRFVRRAPTRG